MDYEDGFSGRMIFDDENEQFLNDNQNVENIFSKNYAIDSTNKKSTNAESANNNLQLNSCFSQVQTFNYLLYTSKTNSNHSQKAYIVNSLNEKNKNFIDINPLNDDLNNLEAKNFKNLKCIQNDNQKKDEETDHYNIPENYSNIEKSNEINLKKLNMPLKNELQYNHRKKKKIKPSIIKGKKYDFKSEIGLYELFNISMSMIETKCQKINKKEIKKEENIKSKKLNKKEKILFLVIKHGTLVNKIKYQKKNNLYNWMRDKTKKKIRKREKKCSCEKCQLKSFFRPSNIKLKCKIKFIGYINKLFRENLESLITTLYSTKILDHEMQILWNVKKLNYKFTIENITIGFNKKLFEKTVLEIYGEEQKFIKDYYKISDEVIKECKDQTKAEEIANFEENEKLVILVKNILQRDINKEIKEKLETNFFNKKLSWLYEDYLCDTNEQNTNFDKIREEAREKILKIFNITKEDEDEYQVSGSLIDNFVEIYKVYTTHLQQYFEKCVPNDKLKSHKYLRVKTRICDPNDKL